MIVLILIYMCILILSSSSVFGSISFSPLAQMKSGISTQNIHCAKNFVLIIKLHNVSPACIKPESITRFLKQDWLLVSYNNTSSKGVLTGYVTFYPCGSVERSIDLLCIGNAYNYTVNVHLIDNKMVKGQINSDMNGMYRIELRPGEYDVVTQTSMMSQNITKSNLVNIEANRTTVFNIMIDSGIR